MINLINNKLLLVSILYSANVGMALSALSFMAIPMYTTFKRLTIVFVLFGEYLVLNINPKPMVIFSVAIMSIGAFIAGAGDLDFSIIGYSFASLSSIIQASYLTIIAKKQKELNVNTFDLMFYNSILSLPFVIIFIVLSGDWLKALSYPELASPGFIIYLIIACVSGALLNYSIFLCTTVNSPLTLTVSGQVKSLITLLFGIFTFGGIELTVLNVSGILLNTSGSISYSIVKYYEKFKKDNSILPLTNHNNHEKSWGLFWKNKTG